MRFAQLRRNVALFICPELDRQVQLRAVFSNLDKSGVVRRLAEESLLRIQSGYPVLNQSDPVVASRIQSVVECVEPISNGHDARIVACEQDRRDRDHDLHHHAEVAGDAFFEGGIGHVSSPADVGAAQGKARAGALDSAAALPRPVAPAASKITTWRTTMLSRLKAGLDRFEETPEADVIGAVALFAFVFLVLALGRLFDGGM